ncbi:MAG: hypothetical protein ABJD11_03585 [Gemmatimonadota bacterium]
MLFIVLLLTVTGLLCYAAYRLGARSDGWALVLPPLLVLAAWHVLLDLPSKPGEGAASGVAVVFAAIWYTGGLCLLLGIILLGAAFYQRRSLVIAAMALLVIGPAIAVLVHRLRPSPPPAEPSPRTAADATYLEGYTWAVDNGITTDTACTRGSPAFVAGCTKAIHRH